MKCTCGSQTQPGPHTGFVELQLLSGPSAPLAHAPASGLAHARSGLPGHKRWTDFFPGKSICQLKGGSFQVLDWLWCWIIFHVSFSTYPPLSLEFAHFHYKIHLQRVHVPLPCWFYWSVNLSPSGILHLWHFDLLLHGLHHRDMHLLGHWHLRKISPRARLLGSHLQSSSYALEPQLPALEVPKLGQWQADGRFLPVTWMSIQ